MKLFAFRKVQLFGVILVLAVSCKQRGCSNSKKVHSESIEQTIGNDVYKIEVSLIESSRYRKMRKTSSSYRVEYDFYKNEEHFSTGISDNNVNYGDDLEPFIANAYVEESKDKFTFRLVVDDYIFNTYINFNNTAMRSPYGNDGVGNIQDPNSKYNNSNFKTDRPKASDFPIDKLPNELSFVRELVEGESKAFLRDFGVKDKAVLADYLVSKNLSEQDYITMFKDWPDASYRDEVFSKERVKELKKSKPIWKDSVKAIILKGAIEERYNFSRNNSMEDFIYNSFADRELIEQLDSVIYPKLKRSFLMNTEETWVLRRIKCPVPLNKEMATLLDDASRRTLNDFPGRDRRGFDLKLDLDIAMTLAKYFGNDDLVHNTLPYYLDKSNYSNHSIRFSDDILLAFPTEDQDQILTFLMDNFGKLSAVSNRDMSSLMEDVIPELEPSLQTKTAARWITFLDHFDGIPLKSIVRPCAIALGCDPVKDEVKKYVAKHGNGDKFWLRLDDDICQ